MRRTIDEWQNEVLDHVTELVGLDGEVSPALARITRAMAEGLAYQDQAYFELLDRLKMNAPWTGPLDVVQWKQSS